jgi:hypothetical protein
MGSLCRQQAAYNSMNKWKLLAEAEYLEHLAQVGPEPASRGRSSAYIGD